MTHSDMVTQIQIQWHSIVTWWHRHCYSDTGLWHGDTDTDSDTRTTCTESLVTHSQWHWHSL